MRENYVSFKNAGNAGYPRLVRKCGKCGSPMRNSLGNAGNAVYTESDPGYSPYLITDVYIKCAKYRLPMHVSHFDSVFFLNHLSHTHTHTHISLLPTCDIHVMYVCIKFTRTYISIFPHLRTTHVGNNFFRTLRCLPKK